jgi:hypothetical protein
MNLQASVLLLVSALAWGGIAKAGTCGSGDPSGRYEGTVKIPDETLELTLNVRCQDGT